MTLSAEIFVALGFLIFVGVFVYVGAHTRVSDAIDARTARIRHDLDEARRLRIEAEELLASYRRKAKEAEAEATAILSLAQTEAELLAKETLDRMNEFIARRSRQAEQKIAMAEAQATADVRAAAADAAADAALRILQAEVRGPVAEQILLGELAEVKKRLH
jgi:F-type H+-transporting ATPase subunit b